MARVARDHEFEAPDGRQVIPAEVWDHQRWGWLESVRRDADLTPMARLVAHVLVLDFANRRTRRCDPSLGDIAAAVGTTTVTVKRAVRQLVDEGWIVREEGRGRGRSNGYAFLTRARIVHLKGVRNDPKKGVRNDPNSDSKRGHICSEKGSDMTPPYIIDKPCKNHGARATAPMPSENPMVIRDAERAVARFRDGHADAISDLKPWILDHILAANLLTPEERDGLGLC